jgi:hypothetical protein
MAINPPISQKAYETRSKIEIGIKVFQIAIYLILGIWLIKHWS